ncbi:MAG: NUDIX domain-containing protein [Sphingomonas sp.]|uniref:NUDIX hydrolase n=1 Tax=Sphingomonas sp. TaxID=28214 RepID=UPI001B282509|nr:NUDIX domain-containing protein [Sphingomonas sp.]MBO9622482.1 NUDIX domain-containing protein [Sphingomonas sp.]
MANQTVFTEPRVGCGAAIIVDGRILLMQRKTAPEAGCWGLPGGKIELFETAPAAVRREVREELGVDIEPLDLLCFVDQIDAATGTHWVAPVYLVERIGGKPAILEPEKHGGLGWFALDDLPAELTCATVAAVEAWRRRRA